MITLPLFEERHRALYAQLAGVRAQLEPIAVRGETGEVDLAGRDAIRISADLGLCRLLVPTAFGGEGLDLRAVCVAREALAGGSGLVDAVFAVQGLGSYPIALSGSTSLGERYLRKVATGEATAAFALTEPDAGSDAGALSTAAVRDGADYLLDGTKVFISNATIASYFVVFARTAAGSKRAISAFIVDAETAGLTSS